MKNQYFGDINDYLKYALLRKTTRWGKTSCCVCWTLTADDDGADGGKTAYLEQPEKYRDHDPALFDFLQNVRLQQGRRDVAALEGSALFPNTRFHSTILTDDVTERAAYFDGLERLSANADLIFFDPDNGLEVKSVRKGRKNSCKYLYLDEVSRFYRKGHSLLIYQHFGRVKRDEYVAFRTEQLAETTGCRNIKCCRTPHVAFFLLVQEQHVQWLGAGDAGGSG